MGRLYAGWRSPLVAAARTGTASTGDSQLARLIPVADRGAPIVTVHDAASHTLAWSVGVRRSGRAGRRGRVRPVGLDP